jgi:tellurite resistance protein TehA-like permease
LTRQNKLILVIEDLPPAYFAMVMATGIVSIAAGFVGFHLIAVVLLWLNVVFYVCLWIVTITRIIYDSKRFAEEFQDFNRGVGYLTTVAGTCILGSQFVILEKSYQTGFALLCLGLGLWVLVIYTVFSSLAIRTGKPSIQDAISGTWLLATVSAQSLSVLAGRLTDQFTHYQEVFLFFSTCMFLLGCAFYFIVITLIFYRLIFKELAPDKLSPTYWINMGAVAISTLAGLVLVEACNGCPVFGKLVPFIFGLTLMCWSMATWWIPILCVLMIWRHVVRGVKLSYSPEYWSMVFPLGMYTACTMKLSEDFNLNFLYEIPHYFIYLAFAAWLMTFFGLLKSIYHFWVDDEVGNDSEKSLTG